MADPTSFGQYNSGQTEKDELTCSECLQSFPVSMMKTSGYKYVCKRCKTE